MVTLFLSPQSSTSSMVTAQARPTLVPPSDSVGSSQSSLTVQSVHTRYKYQQIGKDEKSPSKKCNTILFLFFLPFYVFPFFVCTLAPLSTTSLVSSRPTSTDLPMRGSSTPRVRLPPTNRLRQGAKDSSRAPQPIPMRGSTRYVGCTAPPLTPFTTSRTNSTYSLYGWAGVVKYSGVSLVILSCNCSL